jgi:hypothetical protein
VARERRRREVRLAARSAASRFAELGASTNAGFTLSSFAKSVTRSYSKPEGRPCASSK